MMNKAIITTSWDDGCTLDLKLAELLLKYDTPATFYIPVDNVERQTLSFEEMRNIARYFDIGGHTYHHLDLTKVSLPEVKEEVFTGKEKLENIIGKELFVFCYPMGGYDLQIKNIVKSAGFAGARTSKSSTRQIKDLFSIGTTVHATERFSAHYIKAAIESFDLGLLGYILRKNLFSKTWDRIAMETLDYVVKHGGIWHLWGHSWEIDTYNDWQKLTDVLSKINTLSNRITKVNNSQLIKMHIDSNQRIKVQE
jgi:peptidoglycan-N-acetylglucosamine deacetylase